MIVTTALRTKSSLSNIAMQVSKDLNIPYLKRNNQPIGEIQAAHQSDVIVVGSNRISINQLGIEVPLFFHPNSAQFRVKRYLRGEKDPFIVATRLSENMSFLDCTLGLASDSILSSVVVGNNGQVVGIEANRFLAYIVKQGLFSYKSGNNEMDEAMKRIKVIHMDHYQYLRSLEDNSFDVVYFDPMFEEAIHESDGINPLRKMATTSPLTDLIIEEAVRVAKKRVVLKDHWKSNRFSQFGFSVYKRPTSLFHYGSIELV